MPKKITVGYDQAMLILRKVPGSVAKLTNTKIIDHFVKFDKTEIQRNSATTQERMYLWSDNGTRWNPYFPGAPIALSTGVADMTVFDSLWEVAIPDEYEYENLHINQCIPFTPEGTRFEFLFKQIERFTTWFSHMSYNDSYFGEPAGELKRTAHELERDILNLKSGRK